MSLNEPMKTSAAETGKIFRAGSALFSIAFAVLLLCCVAGCAGTYYSQTAAPESRFNTYHAPYYYPYYPWYSYYGGAYYYAE